MLILNCYAVWNHSRKHVDVRHIKVLVAIFNLGRYFLECQLQVKQRNLCFIFNKLLSGVCPQIYLQTGKTTIWRGVKQLASDVFA